MDIYVGLIYLIEFRLSLKPLKFDINKIIGQYFFGILNNLFENSFCKYFKKIH